jgi:hypothetical protein
MLSGVLSLVLLLFAGIALWFTAWAESKMRATPLVRAQTNAEEVPRAGARSKVTP